MFVRLKRLSSLQRLAALAGVVVLVAACEQVKEGQYAFIINGPREAIAAETAHPILVDSQVKTLEIAITAGGGDLKDFDPAALGELDAFLDGYLEQGSGSLDVAVPLGKGGGEGLMKNTEAIASYALLRGIPRHALAIRAVSETESGGKIVLSYDAYGVTLPPCGDFSSPPTYNPRNIAHGNWGCAYQSNLGLMVADPADLVAPRTMGPRDASRAAKVIRDYREGDKTQSDYSGVTTTIVRD